MAVNLKISDISDEYYELMDVIKALDTSKRNVFWLIKRDAEFPETYKLGSRSIWKRSDIEAYRDIRDRRKNIALTLWERWIASESEAQ